MDWKWTWLHIYRVLFIGLCILTSLKTSYVYGVNCGGYIEASSNSDGIIHSPRYPSNYDDNVVCIWLIEVQSGYSISLSMDEIQLEKEGTGSGCVDFVEIRNGSSIQTLLYHDCDNTSNNTIQARWLWIKFYTNYVTSNKGFTSSWRVVRDPSTSSLKKPFIDCPMEFKCANKECIPWSYRCDSYHDCGCEDQGCDEIDCGGLNLSSDTKVAIGVGVGIFVFILTFVGLGLLDICLKMRADRKYQETIEKQKRLQKQRKAMAMAKLLVTQSSTDGSRMSANTSGLLRVSSTNTMNASLVSVKN